MWQYNKKLEYPVKIKQTLSLIHILVHLIDSDGTLHDNDTSTHAPFGTGVLDIHEIYQKLLDPAYYEGELISIDLCFWPDAWNVTKDSYNYLRSLQLELEANC